MGKQRKPDLLPEVEAKFEWHGVDSVRSLLDPFRGGATARDTLYTSGNASVRRGAVEDWLKWKVAQQTFWTKLAAWAAVVATLFAAASWLFPLR